MKIIKGYECLNACIVNWINNKNIQVTSSDVYFAGGSSKIGYNSETEEINVNAYEKNFDFLDRYNINYKFMEANSKDCENVLMDIVSDGKAITLKISPENLGYTTAFVLNRNVPHFINVLDMNPSKKEVLLGDGYIPRLDSTTFFGWVPIDNVLTAWAEKDYSYILFQDFNNVNASKVKEDAEKNFFLTTKFYVFCPQKCGNKAILALFEDLFKRVRKGNYNQTYIDEFFFKIKVFGFMIEKQMINEKLKCLFAEKTDAYNAIIGKWNSVLLFTRKAIYTNRIDKLDVLYDKIKKLIEEECCLFDSILNSAIC